MTSQEPREGRPAYDKDLFTNRAGEDERLRRERNRLRRQVAEQKRMGRYIRTTWMGQAMSAETAARLLGLARKQYGIENARLAVLVRTGAIEKVVDNARDARESIRRLLGR